MTKPNFSLSFGLSSLAALLALGLQSPAHAQLGGKATFPIPNAKGMKTLCDTTMAAAKKQVQVLEKNTSGKGFLAQWNQLDAVLQAADGPASLVANVFTDKATREAAEACSTALTAYSTELYQNPKLYANVLKASAVDAVDETFKKSLRQDFEDTGVALDDAKRTRMKAILDKLESLRQSFDRNVREDATTVLMSPSEVAGMPESWSKPLKKDAQGSTIVTLSYPAYLPYMQLGSNADARQRLWTAKTIEGGEANIKLLNEIRELRHEMAGLFGLPSYADFVTRRRMVGNSSVANAFLKDVQAAVAAGEKSDMEELRAAKAEHLGTALATTAIHRWDTSFYSERLRKARYAIDQEALRKYFPTEESLAFTLKVASDLYGVSFTTPTKAAKPKTWHPDVRYLEVFDSTSKAFLGNIYLDLFPREDKYNHAAAWGIRGSSALLKRNPSSVLVTNFNRQGLTHDELETLLHEFGHVLHGVLSTTRYVGLAGTSVKRDFVEAPSQMFEEWARRADTLALFKAVCAACPQLSAEQIKSLDNARTFGRGMRYARQQLYASYDMTLHGPERFDAQALWAKMEGDTPLGHVPNTLFVAGFGHLASGYGAGYYGYLWSEVLALDMLNAFKGKLMDPAVGKRYRNTILANGGERDPMALVTELLGRAPNRDAFNAEMRGQR